MFGYLALINTGGGGGGGGGKFKIRVMDVDKMEI